LPGGPVGPESKWAATSNFEVGQKTYTVNRGNVVREGTESSEGQEEREGGIGIGEEAQGPLAREGGLYLYTCAPPPRVPSYATADGAGVPTYPGPV